MTAPAKLMMMHERYAVQQRLPLALREKTRAQVKAAADPVDTGVLFLTKMVVPSTYRSSTTPHRKLIISGDVVKDSKSVMVSCNAVRQKQTGSANVSTLLG